MQVVIKLCACVVSYLLLSTAHAVALLLILAVLEGAMVLFV